MRYRFLDPDEVINTSDFEFIASFLRATGRAQIGWHYFIDLAWIYSKAKDWPTTYRILDAGGGSGPTQFLLSELGFNVTNLDLFLSEPPSHIKKRYRIESVAYDSYQSTEYVAHLVSQSTRSNGLRKLKSLIVDSRFYQYASEQRYDWIHKQWRKNNGIVNEVGGLDWRLANLCNVPEISSNYFDAVVSLSALEHIPINLMSQAWAEIKRICKADAKFAITTSATERRATWFHEPSKGNCFSEYDLNAIFDARVDESSLPANEMIERYRSCSFLRANVASFYRKSSENGMPWGKWDPKYFPVALF